MSSSSAPAPHTACGIVPVDTPKERPKIALTSVHAKVEILNACNRTVLTQKFTNFGENAIEVKYVFPIERDAAVCGFEARINGKAIKGTVQGKKEAKKTYDDAVKNKQVAALLEKKRNTENTFVCHVGNLLPKESCQIKITYVSELDSEGPSIRFVLPTLVSNGHIPWDGTAASKKEPEPEVPILTQQQMARMSDQQLMDYMMKQSEAQARADEERRKQKATKEEEAEEAKSAKRVDASELEYELTIVADVQMASEITRVTASSSSQHALKTVYDKPNRRILKLTSGTKLDKDFVMLIDQSDPYLTRAQIEEFDANGSSFKDPTLKNKEVEQKEEEGKEGKDNEKASASQVVQVSFNREFVEPDTDMFCEVIFLVDVSGSMAGQRIKNTKETLQVFLNSLPTNCLFNIVAFSHRHAKLFPHTKPYNNNTLAEAQLFVENMRANGGTQIYRPLHEILTTKPVEGYPRQVFLLTDGEVGDTDRFVRMAGESAVSTRIFSFGVGRGASLPLCKGLARKSRGMFEMIVESDKITEQVMRIITSALQPPLCNAVVDWGEGIKPLGNREDGKDQEQQQISKVSFQVPARPPPIYPGRQFIYATNVRVLSAEGGGGKSVVTIASSHNKEEEKVAVDISGVKPHRGSLLHVLAAKARIRELEERAPKPLSQRQRDEIRRLGLRFNLASSETSFVAVLEKEDDVNEGVRSETPAEPEQHVVPIVGVGGGGGGHCMTSPPAPALSAAPVTERLEAVRRAMESSIEESLARGENLERMMDKSEDLAVNANTFIARAQKKTSMFGGFLNAINPFGRRKCSVEEASFNSAEKEEEEEEDHDSSSSDDAREDSSRGGQRLPGPARVRPEGAAASSRSWRSSSSSSGSRKAPKKAPRAGGEKDPAKSDRGGGGFTLQDNDSALRSLLRAQHSNGSWALDSKLCRVLRFLTKTDRDEKELVGACAKALRTQGLTPPGEQGQGQLEAVAATLLGLAMLLERYPGKKSSYVLLVIKARRFVAAKCGCKSGDVGLLVKAMWEAVSSSP